VEKRDKIEESGNSSEPYSESERNQIDAISYILDAMTHFQKSEHKKFMAMLKERLNYQVGETGTTVNKRYFEICDAEFINRRYIEEIAKKLTQAIEDYNRETN
jgi:predicted solute-binding protein